MPPPGRLATVRPELAAAALRIQARALRERGIRLVWAQGLRTNNEQVALYAIGRSLPGKVVTNAATATDTPHGRGAAVDFAILDAQGKPTWADAALASYDIVGRIGEEEGLEWGGRWKRPDRPHLQLPAWRQLPVLP